MFNHLKNWQKNKRGFTLVELIIAMLVFTIFMGAVSTVYISVTRSLRHASEVRKVYAEARYLMDRVTQDVRLYTVDYECLNGGGNETVTYAECSSYQGRFLPLISADGTHRLIYKFEDTDSDGIEEFSMLELDYDSVNGWEAADGYYGNWQEFTSDAVNLDDIHFDIYPAASPYDRSNPQYQPSVHVVVGATSRSVFLPDQLTITLQSTISSRVYGVSFENF